MGFIGMVISGFLVMEKLFGSRLDSASWWWVVVPALVGWAITLFFTVLTERRG